MIPDAVIIGGGLSGLAAAVKISAGGGRVELLEQSTRLGGRCYSWRDAVTGETVDNGQHVLLGSYRALLHYLGVIGTAHHLRAAASLELPFHYPGKGFASFRVSTLPAPLDLTSGILSYRLLSVREKTGLLRAGKWLRAWTGAKAASVAPQTVAEWLTALGQGERARQCFWDPIAISVMNERPETASALLFATAMRKAFIEKGADSRMLIPGVGQTELYVNGALRFLSARGSRVRVNAAVGEILSDGRRAGGVRLRDGAVVSAPCVIPTVPPWALAEILPENGPAAAIRQAALGVDASPIVSATLWYDRPFMNGTALGLIGKHYQWIFNRRELLGEGGGRGGCVSCVISAARDALRMTKQSLAGLAAEEIRSVFPAAARARVVHSVVVKEKRATFSPTPEAESRRPPAETPLVGLLLAGDWTATGLPATIEGAVASGYTAAAMVLKR